MQIWDTLTRCGSHETSRSSIPSYHKMNDIQTARWAALRLPWAAVGLRDCRRTGNRAQEVCSTDLWVCICAATAHLRDKAKNHIFLPNLSDRICKVSTSVVGSLATHRSCLRTATPASSHKVWHACLFSAIASICLLQPRLLYVAADSERCALKQLGQGPQGCAACCTPLHMGDIVRAGMSVVFLHITLQQRCPGSTPHNFLCVTDHA